MSKVNTSSSRGKNVVAHILDTNEGYKKEAWDVGEAIHSDVADYLSDNGSLFVVVTYDNGRAEAAIFKQEVWKVLKRLFDAVDQGGAKALEAALHKRLAGYWHLQCLGRQIVTSEQVFVPVRSCIEP